MTQAAEPPRGARIAVSTYFLLLGLTSAVWVARIPAVKERLALSDGQLGIALLAVPAGLMLGTQAGGRLVDRFGSGRMTQVAGVVSCLLLLAPGIAASMAGLMVALLATGIAGGALDVSMNSHGVRVEIAYRRPVMASMHACYSLGGFAGALFGGAFAWADIGPEPAFVAAGLPAAAVAAGAGRWLSGLPPAAPAGPDPRPAAAAAPPGPPGLPHQRSAQHPHEPGPAVSRRALSRTGWLVLALGILGLCALVGEGAAGDWSAVYLHDSLGASAGLAAVGYGVFSVMMTAGRLLGDRLAARLGPVRLVRGCGLLAAAGLTAGLLSHSIAGALAGFAVLGAGLSCVVPQVFSAGGRADPIRPGRGLARVVGLGYLGLAGGPVVIGACASLTGLRVALGIPVVLCVWVAVSARALAPRTPAPGRGAPGPAALGPRVPP
ncbi:MAG TPA: MFS transporter [Streptosporangiaceae bacterium]